MEDKYKTNINSCGPRPPSMRDKWVTSAKLFDLGHPEWETRTGNNQETSVNSCGLTNPEWETNM